MLLKMTSLPSLPCLSLIAGASLLAASAASASSATKPLTAKEVEALIPQIEETLTKAQKQWKTPGIAIGIVAEDRLVYAKGFGIRKAGGSEPVDQETVFEIGSTSKAFVAATQAIQVDDGTYGWNDRVIDFFPDFRLADPWVTREFRLVDLLAQRSGLPAYTLTDMALYGYEAEAIIHGLRHIEPITSFRAEFGYQNAFHLVAGKIIEQTSGSKAWGDFLHQRLLKPLGMNSTHHRVEAIVELKNVASGHRIENDEVTPDPRSVFPYNVVPAGGLNSNVKDLSQWLRLQINGGSVDSQRLVSEENLTATRTSRVPLPSSLAAVMGMGPGDTPSYANGWIIHSLPQGRVIEHGGSTGGFTTFVGFDPDRRVGLVILSNLAYDIGLGSSIAVGPSIMELLQGAEPGDHSDRLWTLQQRKDSMEKERDSVAPTQPPLPGDAYAGSYESPVLGKVEVAKGEGNSLKFTLGPRALPVRLTPMNGNRFRAEVDLHSDYGKGMTLPGHAEFTVNTAGVVESFLLDTMDSAGQPPFQRLPAKP